MPAKKITTSIKAPKTPAKKTVAKASKTLAKKTAAKASKTLAKKTVVKASKNQLKKTAAKPLKKTAAQLQSGVSIYEIKITLQYLVPPIWRRVQVKSDTTFGQLHAIIQMAMDWTNSHLHHFIVGKRPNLKYIKMARDADFDLDYLADKDQMSEDDVTIGQVLTKAKSKLDYEYDFGDGWLHEILVERIFEPEPGVTYPRCVAGEYACPPDDVGGPPGYLHFIQVISNPKHPEHRELKEWAGGPFDPYKFDINQVNKMLSVRRNFILYGRGLS